MSRPPSQAPLWAALSLCALSSAQASPLQTVAGERLDLSKDLGEAVIESADAVLERLRARGEQPFFINRTRPKDAQGQWLVPSPKRTHFPHSGDNYIYNRWGDLDMSLAFGQVVNLEGAFIAGHGPEGSWATGLLVIGYRNGTEVGRTTPFHDIDETSNFFLMDLEGVDRVEFRAEASAAGAGWYGLDDLTFLQRGDGTQFGKRVTLDFESLSKRTELTDSSYGGITWEIGQGHFQDPVEVHEPVAPPISATGLLPRGATGGGLFFGGSGTLPDLVSSFVGPKVTDDGAGWVPPDTCGAVGPNHFVAVVNQHISIYDKSTGNRLLNSSLRTWFNTNNHAGDPRAAYDADNDRWVVIACDFATRIWLAYSETNDPMGNWFKTPITVSQGADSNRWPDYPGLGVDQNGVYFTINMFPNGGAGFGATIIAVDSAPLNAASPSLGTVTAWRSLSGGSLQPCITYGDAPGEYVADLTGSSMRLRRVNPPLNNPTLTTVGNTNIGSWNSPPNAPSLGVTTSLDTLDGRLMNAVWRNGSVWATHCVSRFGRAGVRWYEVAVPSLSLEQKGNIDDSSLYYFFPSIAVNANDDVVLGFSGSDENTYAGCYYTGRLSTDPDNQVAVPAVYRAGIGPYGSTGDNGTNRWGDYSLTVIDPTDDTTFWTIQEYARSGGNWGTFIAEFEYAPSCPAPSNFCSSTPNSSGQAAGITILGSTTVSANDLDLIAFLCPAGQVGIFYYGPNESSQAFGNGTRCVGGSTTRLPIVSTDIFGEARWSLDLTNLPPGGGIQAGDTVKFQFWFRDPAAGGAAFDLTDGLSATFCP
ncbi:MAG: hypothetical protein ACI841_003371 [Planctomycetota bacterium]|jgi:hypothetical protein